MTIESTASRISYNGNGTTTVFPFPYRFIDEADLTVILVDSDGTATTKTITTHYTVLGEGDSDGGTVTMITAPASGEILVLIDDPDLVQELNLRENDEDPAESQEEALDRLTLVTQRLKSLISRSIVLPDGFTDTYDPTLPTELTADSFLKVNSDGTGWELSPLGDVSDVPIAGTGLVSFNGTTGVGRTITGDTNEISIGNGSGVSSNPTVGIADDPIIPGTGKIRVPSGTTAQRPSSPLVGDVRYNSDLGLYEYYKNGNWFPILDVTSLPVGNGVVSNLGMTLASGTLTFNGANGSALSATNPCYITVPGTASGTRFRLAITANLSFTDDNFSGTSDTDDTEFGITASRNWAQDRPTYLYACNGDNTDSGLRLFWSFDPTLRKAPLSTGIAYKLVDMSSPSDSGAFFITSTDPTSAYASKPCVLIGGFRMQWSSSTTDWSVQTLDSSKGDGIRHDPFVGKVFNMPLGQMGAENNNAFFCSSGTAPAWATPANILYYYKVNLDGQIHVSCLTTSAGAVTNGSGGPTQLQLALPYYAGMVLTTQNVIIGGYVATGATTAAAGLASANITGGTNAAGLNDYGFQSILNNDFSTNTNDLFLDLKYHAFSG